LSDFDKVALNDIDTGNIGDVNVETISFFGETTCTTILKEEEQRRGKEKREGGREVNKQDRREENSRKSAYFFFKENSVFRDVENTENAFGCRARETQERRAGRDGLVRFRHEDGLSGSSGRSGGR
jgi:hypothetical protein